MPTANDNGKTLRFKSVSTRPFTSLDARNHRKRSRVFLWQDGIALSSLDGARKAVRDAMAYAGLSPDIELCKPLRKDSVDTPHFIAALPYPITTKDRHGETAVDLHIHVI